MTLSTFTAVSAWTDKAALSPAAMNLRLSEITINLTQLNSEASTLGIVRSGSTVSFPIGNAVLLKSIDSGGVFFDVRAFGGVVDGATDDTVAVGAAASAASAQPVGGLVFIPPNTSYSRSSLSGNDEVIYLDASHRHQGRNIVVWHKPVDVSGFAAAQHAELIHHTIEVVGSAATVDTIRVDGGFDIVAMGKQTGTVTSSDGSGVDQVIVKGTYLEHRSSASLNAVWGLEVAGSLYGNGKIRTIKGIESVAQISAPSLGNFSGQSGSGEVTNAIGIVGVARINTSSNTGLLNSGIGVQGTVLHRGTSVVSTLRCFNGTLQNLGTGAVAVYQGLAFDGSLTGAGTIAEIDYIVIPNAPAPTGLLTTVIGLRVDEQSRASTNRTAWFRGDLHVDGDRDVILNSSSTVWDSTVSTARVHWNSTTNAVEVFASLGSTPTLSVKSAACNLSVGSLTLSSNTSIGTGLAAIGATAPPGVGTVATAYTWIHMVAPDGSSVWVPAWK